MQFEFSAVKGIMLASDFISLISDYLTDLPFKILLSVENFPTSFINIMHNDDK